VTSQNEENMTEKVFHSKADSILQSNTYIGRLTVNYGRQIWREMIETSFHPVTIYHVVLLCKSSFFTETFLLVITDNSDAFK
jgi:hypothetical protein